MMDSSSSDSLSTPLLNDKKPKCGNEDITRTATVEEEEGGRMDEELDDESIEQVALTVPTSDDPTMEVVTFRVWALGLISCTTLAFLNQFFSYRREPLSITAVSAQIAVLPIGRLMAAALPNRKVRIPGFAKWEFSLNPGPFNIKEHVLITIFAGAGATSVTAVHVVNIVNVFYRRRLDPFVGLLIVFTTQILGFGWAGLFRGHLVEPSAMWWPANLVQVSVFRALHEEEERRKGGVTRNQFFLIALVCSFAYYVLPGYLIPMVTSVSWICWAFPDSVVAQQIGSGIRGLGVGAVGFDWSTISSYLGSPLAAPWFAIANVTIGFVLVMYVITPLAYWLNVYDARGFPIFSQDLFTSDGQIYNISKIVDSNFHMDMDAYQSYGRLHLSTFFVFSYGIGFAALAATVTHAILFHGKDIWRVSKCGLKMQSREDVHTRLMRKYPAVPQWWFIIILVTTVIAAIAVCEIFNTQVQLRWWGVVFASGLAIFFTLPMGIIKATTNQRPGLNVISEYILGYIYPGRPVANICFKVYSDVAMSQALTFLQDFKLGHYMKIPPRAMFMAQMVGTSVAAAVYLGTAWWLIGTVPNICNKSVLPSDSPWVCPLDQLMYDASVIWGLIGPRRVFGDLGPYWAVNWCFLGGAIAPFLAWAARRAWPHRVWIKYINVPVLIGATGLLPPATPVNFTSWLIMGFIFSFVIYRYHRQWWQRHSYVLSAGLDAGLAFMGVLLYVTFGLENVSFRWWGANSDGCPLASCPTDRNVNVGGCSSRT